MTYPPQCLQHKPPKPISRLLNQPIRSDSVSLQHFICAMAASCASEINPLSSNSTTSLSPIRRFQSMCERSSFISSFSASHSSSLPVGSSSSPVAISTESSPCKRFQTRLKKIRRDPYFILSDFSNRCISMITLRISAGHFVHLLVICFIIC